MVNLAKRSAWICAASPSAATAASSFRFHAAAAAFWAPGLPPSAATAAEASPAVAGLLLPFLGLSRNRPGFAGEPECGTGSTCAQHT